MKSFLSIAALLIVSKLAAIATPIDLGYASGNTPYDAYMQPVKQVLRSLKGEGTSMEEVKKLMRQGRNFRYSFTEPYTAALPEVTARVKAGDCKAKSLWLVDQINDENIRFVVGKARSESRMSHAWVLWKNEGRWWILDCTNTSRPIAADTVAKNDYIPLYSWSKNGSFRHTATQTFAAGVAGKDKMGVGSRADRR